MAEKRCEWKSQVVKKTVIVGQSYVLGTVKSFTVYL